MAAALRWVLLPWLGLIGTVLAWNEYDLLRVLDWQDLEGSQELLVERQPWGGLPGRALAVAADESVGLEPERAEAILAWQLPNYPLDPTRWLARAMNAQHAGENPKRVLDFLRVAQAIQPGHRDVQWRAALIARDLGDHAAAEHALRAFLQDHPGGVRNALMLAAQWLPDPHELIERILPEGEDHLLVALRMARQEAWIELAVVAWERLSMPRAPDDRGLLDFVDLMLAEDYPDFAMFAWWQSFPDYEPGAVPNADFRHELASHRALHWRTRTPEGVRTFRDTGVFVTEPASLRLNFEGVENVNLHGGHLRLRIPVLAGPQRWRLSGYWKAENLTTNSRPHLRLASEAGGAVRAEVPAATFDWTPFELEIETSGGLDVLNLQIRRSPVRIAFDRNIRGRLWLDALRLEPLDGEPDA